MADLLTLLVEHVMPIALALGGLGLVLLIWWVTVLASRLWARESARPAAIPAGLSLAPEPFMSAEEAALYNVLRLAVQDDYLLFAQVSLWCLVDMKSEKPDVRQSFLAQIALKRVDFVLVHPGTLTPVKVVEVMKDDSPQRLHRNRLVEETLTAAGIEYVRLPAGKSYTIADLTSVLDIEPAE